MAHAPVTAIWSKYGNSGTLDPSAFSRTGTAYTDPNLFAVMLAQAQNQNMANILFGESDTAFNSVFGSDTTSNGVASGNSSLFGGSSTSSFPSDLSGIAGQMTAYSGTPKYLELIARSNLVGKTITYYNPTNTKETLEGVVQSVAIDNGILQISLGTTTITPEYLKSVKS